MVPYIGGWVLHDEYAAGEHLVYDAADFDVNVKVTEGEYHSSLRAESRNRTANGHVTACTARARSRCQPATSSVWWMQPQAGRRSARIIIQATKMRGWRS
ncbi:MAG: hypothetical protein MZV64_00155 [Ignavibacteriales bacterium]|nr:hypothetical protein [Ignavibacteriales bacterium]